MPAKKFDEGKVPLDLLPKDSIYEIAKALGFGAKKYGRFNWMDGFSYSRIVSALLRHITEWNNGEDLDYHPDTCQGCKKGDCQNHSGLSHLANAGCNLMFLIWLRKHRPELDDRHTAVRSKENGLQRRSKKNRKRKSNKRTNATKRRNGTRRRIRGSN